MIGPFSHLRRLHRGTTVSRTLIWVALLAGGVAGWVCGGQAVIAQVKQQFAVPTFAYQVSGEYAMLVAASQQQWINERDCVLESLLCFKRAGADAVLTYYAKSAAQWLNAIDGR